MKLATLICVIALCTITGAQTPVQQPSSTTAVTASTVPSVWQEAKPAGDPPIPQFQFRPAGNTFTIIFDHFGVDLRNAKEKIGSAKVHLVIPYTGTPGLLRLTNNIRGAIIKAPQSAVTISFRLGKTKRVLKIKTANDAPLELNRDIASVFNSRITSAYDLEVEVRAKRHANETAFVQIDTIDVAITPSPVEQSIHARTQEEGPQTTASTPKLKRRNASNSHGVNVQQVSESKNNRSANVNEDSRGACSPTETAFNKCVNKYGEVTVGRPKVWTFERVFSTVDGLLRDIDAVSLANLDSLNPSETNQTLIDLLQTSLDVRGKYDQGAAVQNSIQLKQYMATHDVQINNQKAWADAKAALNNRQAQIVNQMVTAEDARAKLDPTTDGYTNQTKIITDLKTQLDDIKAAQTSLGEKPPIDSLPSFNATTPPGATDYSHSLTPLTQLSPDTVNKLLGNPASPSFPATKKLDNFITLLHERLNRELTAIYDDGLRHEHSVYLLQFDLGVYPTKDSADRVAKVEFAIDHPRDAKGTDISEAAYCYDLYPGASSYNITQFFGKSSRTGILGTATTLLGFGATVEYQRQRDQARSSLTQSVYLSGFGSGSNHFGWYIGPSPAERLVSPGIRSTNVLIVVPTGTTTVDITPRIGWQPREQESKDFDNLPSYSLRLPANHPLNLERVAYQTVYGDSNGGKNDSAYLQIIFKELIDPNLVVTVNGKLIPRVRDTRGRATGSSSTQAEYATIYNTLSDDQKKKIPPPNSRFGLLEADNAAPDTWFAVGPRGLVLNVSRDTAGEGFPTIRLLDSGQNGGELTRLTDREDRPSIRIGEWDLPAGYPGHIPSTIFRPLFSNADRARFFAYYDDTKPLQPIQSIQIERSPDAGQSNTILRNPAQVMLTVPTSNPHYACLKYNTWPLDCTGEDGKLTCTWPAAAIAAAMTANCPAHDLSPSDYLVAVETPSTAAEHGLFGRTTLQKQSEVQVRIVNTWAPTELLSPDGSVLAWDLELQTERLQPDDGIGDSFRTLDPCTGLSSTPYTCAQPRIDPSTGRTISIFLRVATQDLLSFRDKPWYIMRPTNGAWLVKAKVPDIFQAILPTIAITKTQSGSTWQINGPRARAISAVILKGCTSCTFATRSNGLNLAFVDIPADKIDKDYALALNFANVIVDAQNDKGEQLVMRPPPPSAPQRTTGGVLAGMGLNLPRVESQPALAGLGPVTAQNKTETKTASPY